MELHALLRKLHPVQWLPMSKVQRLRWYLARVNRSYRRDMAKARKEGLPREKREEIQQGLWAVTDELHQELEALRTKRLLRQANRLDVQTPPIPWNEQRDEYWVQGNMTGEWYLTTAGINKVRADIRAEIKGRHEARAHWVAWVSAITGLVGALTGLAAVLLSK